MKTFRSFTATISILSAALVFILTGCQKDELPVVSGTASTQSDQYAKPVNPVTLNFRMISIEHNAGPTKAADYTVTIMSNGEFTFEGRKNTATIGIRTMQLPKEMMGTLAGFFSGDNFEGISQEPVSNDLASLTVIYKADVLHGLIKRSANEISTSKLIAFTEKLENVLNIKAFTQPVNTDHSPFPIDHN